MQVRASPELPWELGSLARRAGLSRSAFSARTTAMLGEPLGSYVRKLRLRRASVLLESTALPVKVIASRVGYESEAAFARAFARERGESPSAHRQARSGLCRSPRIDKAPSILFSGAVGYRGRMSARRRPRDQPLRSFTRLAAATLAPLALSLACSASAPQPRPRA